MSTLVCGSDLKIQSRWPLRSADARPSSIVGRGPEFISRPLVLAGEVLGSLLFLNLLKKAGEVLRHDPELRDAVEERICEVMNDELGHISYDRTLLGSGGLARTRAILPLVRLGLRGSRP